MLVTPCAPTDRRRDRKPQRDQKGISLILPPALLPASIILSAFSNQSFLMSGLADIL
jgi:hypothetical protein